MYMYQNLIIFPNYFIFIRKIQLKVIQYYKKILIAEINKSNTYNLKLN